MTEQEIHEEQEVEVPVSYLPEAGGVAFLELWGTVTDSATERREAFKINITARGLSPQEALDSIIDCMKYANERYHLKPYNPLAPKPAQACWNHTGTKRKDGKRRRTRAGCKATIANGGGSTARAIGQWHDPGCQGCGNTPDGRKKQG
jgi:hypothetical protein